MCSSCRRRPTARHDRGPNRSARASVGRAPVTGLSDGARSTHPSASTCGSGNRRPVRRSVGRLMMRSIVSAVDSAFSTALDGAPWRRDSAVRVQGTTTRHTGWTHPPTQTAHLQRLNRLLVAPSAVSSGHATKGTPWPDQRSVSPDRATPSTVALGPTPTLTSSVASPSAVAGTSRGWSRLSRLCLTGGNGESAEHRPQPPVRLERPVAAGAGRHEGRPSGVSRPG